MSIPTVMRDRIYFSNLNSIRFIAALLVIICHIELNKKYFEINNFRQQFKEFGIIGVDLFFVLSGFLITFLLLKEKEKYNIINFKNFYLRRILRIWPLYYFIILLSLFVLPNFSLFFIPNQTFHLSGFKETCKVFCLFLFLMPNVLFFIKPISFASQTWSIGTEEQFYLIWPLVISKIKKLKKFLIGLILLYWILYFIFNLPFFYGLPYFGLFKNYYAVFKVDVLAFGALGAVFLFEKEIVLKRIINNRLFIASVVFSVLLYFLNIEFVEIKRILYAAFFMIIILNLVANKSLTTLLENKISNYLGKISYGLYMYHQIIIVFIINILKKFHVENSFFIYFGSIFTTILIAHFSYKFLERPFLKIKSKYAPFEN